MFVYFPLHLQPEATTAIRAPFYLNQVALVENIAKSIPVDMKLYVKEHPAMAGKRDSRYYHEIRKIPNVRLIDASVSSHALIKNSSLVATITGTVGWEALLMKKPVITFGHVFYNAMDSVRKCKNITDLPYMVKNAMGGHKHDERELVDFVSAIIENSFGAGLNVFWSKDRQKYIESEETYALIDALAKELELEKTGA